LTTLFRISRFIEPDDRIVSFLVFGHNVAFEPINRHQSLLSGNFCPRRVSSQSQTTVQEITEHGIVIPKGAVGTIVRVVRDGPGYDVEFTTPHAVVAATHEQLCAISPDLIEK
jgi:hypothetical protein